MRQPVSKTLKFHAVDPLLLVMVGYLCVELIHEPLAAQDMYRGFAAHDQGNIQLTVDPRGGWGYCLIVGTSWQAFPDPFSNDSVYGCVYPRSTRQMFGAAGLAVGGVLGEDTLVTDDIEWSSDGDDFASTWIVKGSDPSKSYFSSRAHSDLDLECSFRDTAAIDYDISTIMPVYERPNHKPLGLEVRRRSMAWSGAMVDDFVLFEYQVTNIGAAPLHDAYICFTVSCPRLSYQYVGDEDRYLTGFVGQFESPGACVGRDTLNIAYLMDNDGDPAAGSFSAQSKRGAVGLMLMGGLIDSLELGYTWVAWDAAWERDWGPRRRGTVDAPLRSFNPYYAWPANDRNLYHVISHPRVAYDQLFAATDHDGWLPPQTLSSAAAAGWPSYTFYSFGPFNIGVNEKINFTIAVVGGDNVHTNPTAIFDPLDPQPYYNQLDFSELATNARWAQWVYDNPGVDTDSDGYFGEYRVCEGETTWYKGDGVPDFRGNSPPPIPFTRYETESGKVVIRWNGFLSETTKDVFSGLYDFEGYRVYCGLDNRRTSLSLLTGYDKQDWFRWKYNELGSGASRWVNDDPPFSLDSLRALHNDPDFDPEAYPRERPLHEADSVFYFEAVDANVYDLTSATGIHKAYPDAVNPGIDSTLWTDADITTEHGRKLPKYYEYEYVIDNLLPTVPYFVSVTVFDFGYAGGRGNMPPDETTPLNNVTEVYAQIASETVEEQRLDAYVYPNPYRADAGYEDHGYENRKGNIIPDRARLIHFANLPRVCKISIYSLDGDLIGTIDHNFPEGGPESMHDWWNLVSRTGLAVESGLYFWVVESAERTQIGKLVILK